ncbi:hypothetical protein JHK85_049048 [Glycine max]|nr:hypothetical protein JHK85_049048 [Glycine max]
MKWHVQKGAEDLPLQPPFQGEQFFGHNTNERPTRSNFSQVTTIVVYEDVGDFSDNEDLTPSEITFYRDVCGEEIFEGEMVSSDEVRDFSRDKSDLYEDMTSP